MRTGLRVLGLGAACILANATLVSAADLGGPPAPPYASYTPEFNWAGLYMGIHGGGGWGNAVSSTPADLSVAGPYLGARVGYDMEYAQIVFGVLADINWSGIDGMCLAVACAPAPATVHEINWFGTLRGKLGYSMGTWLPYITAGGAWAGASRTSGGTQTANNTHSGWAAGVGLAWAFSQNWIAHAEYKYLDFGSRTYVFVPGVDPVVDLNVHTIEVGVSYKY
jgi:outer membrane immunogenic protein